MTIKTTNKFSIISILNWSTYQVEQPKNGQQNDQQLTNKRPTTDHKQECKELKNTTLSGKPDDAPFKSSKSQNIPVKEIIDHLNQKTSKNFRANTKSTQNYIKARWKDGFTLADFIAVIDRKTEKWRTDPDMADYLRPETLFGPKFEAYLNESEKTTSSPSKGMREFRAGDPLLIADPMEH